VWWQGGVYAPLTNCLFDETPPYTLPGEGIAQSRAFLFLPNRYGDNNSDGKTTNKKAIAIISLWLFDISKEQFTSPLPIFQ
jgi:hypothetical protein